LEASRSGNFIPRTAEVSIASAFNCTPSVQSEVRTKFTNNLLPRDHINKLHKEELHNLYSSPNIIKMIQSRARWAGPVARKGAKRNAYGILVGKPEGKRPLGRPRRRWVDNINMDLR
jgi:hypothetical protein